MIELAYVLGRMIGLGTSAGVRPSLTIAVLGMMHHLHAGAALNSTFSFLGSWQAIVLFVVLAMIESGFDKIPRFDRLQNRLSMPYRVIMGGLAAAATMPYGVLGIAVGVAVGGLVAWFAIYTKQQARPRTTPSIAIVVLGSTLEDIAAFLTTLVTLVYSPFGYLALGFTTAIQLRSRYLHHAKYRSMQREGGRSRRFAVDEKHDQEWRQE